VHELAVGADERQLVVLPAAGDSSWPYKRDAGARGGRRPGMVWCRSPVRWGQRGRPGSWSLLRVGCRTRIEPGMGQWWARTVAAGRCRLGASGSDAPCGFFPSSVMAPTPNRSYVGKYLPINLKLFCITLRCKQRSVLLFIQFVPSCFFFLTMED
jgi:hypothetical protein